MDKNFLNEHNLTESQKRFQSILEYVQRGGSNVLEDDNMGDGAPAPGADPAMGGAPAPGGDPTMGGAPGADPAMGGDPNGGAAPADGSAPAPGADPAMGDNTNGGASNGVEEFNPQGADTNAAPAPATEPQPEEGEDEEVIDVDELVDSQDDTNAKVNNLDGKIEALIQLIGKFKSDIDKNDAHIEELKQEFEKRNPTQVEKMTLRAKQGYPFTQSPDDYWENKEAEGNYSPESDNDGVGDERYEITKNDVDNITDWNSIYRSIDKGSFHQNLKDILNF